MLSQTAHPGLRLLRPYRADECNVSYYAYCSTQKQCRIFCGFRTPYPTELANCKNFTGHQYYAIEKEIRRAKPFIVNALQTRLPCVINKASLHSKQGFLASQTRLVCSAKKPCLQYGLYVLCNPAFCGCENAGNEKGSKPLPICCLLSG